MICFAEKRVRRPRHADGKAVDVRRVDRGYQ